MRTKGRLAFAALVWVAVGLCGCGLFGGGDGSGGNVGGVPQALLNMIVQYGGQTDLEAGNWHSPTAEPGMEQVHVATIIAVQLAVSVTPQIKGFCETNVGAILLLKVANYAACPVSKGALMAGGWMLIEYDHGTGEGYIGRLYYIKKGDVIIGQPSAPILPDGL